MKQKLLTLLTALLFLSSGAWGADFIINCDAVTSGALFTVDQSYTQYAYSSNDNIAGWKLINASSVPFTLKFTNEMGTKITGISFSGVADNNSNKSVVCTISDGSESVNTGSSSWNNRKSASYTTKAISSSNVAKLSSAKDTEYTVTISGYACGFFITVTYESTTTTIGTTGWSTYSNVKALDFAHAIPSNPASADLKAYMITGAAGTSITKSAALDDAPGSTGLLINGTAGETYSIPVLASSSTSTTGNLMKPCVTATTVNYNDNDGWNYVLMNNSGTPEFQKIVSGTYSSANVGAGKAYLALTSDPGSRALSLFDDETTGVASVDKTQMTANNEFYNLAGQRVTEPSKGLYIVNGKKVVIK